MKWLLRRSSLSDAEVAEAIQFGTPPLVKNDRVIITTGVAIAPVMLSLFVGTVQVLGHLSAATHGITKEAALNVTAVLWLASLGTLLTVVLAALGARRRPFVYARVAFIGTVGWLLVMLSACLFCRELGLITAAGYEGLTSGLSTTYLFHRALDGAWIFHLVLQTVCALMLTVPVALAWLRARRVRAARRELMALKERLAPKS